MKKVIFVVLLLAIAGLGLALPSKTPKVSNLPPPNLPSPKVRPPTNLPKLPPTVSVSTLAPAPTTPPPTTALPAELSSPQALADELKISKTCSTALLSIVTSPEFLKCIPLNSVIPLVPILTDPNFFKNFAADPAGSFKKVEPAFIQFSKTFCPAPKCSDKGVQGAIKAVSDGCAAELKDNQVIQMVFGLIVFYSPLHDTVCFESNVSKNFCWDESLQTVFGLPKSPIKISGNPLLDSVAVADCKAVCTDCNKSIVNTFFNFIKSKDNQLPLQVLAGIGIDQKAIDGMTLGVAVKCGINFEDGKIPNKY